MKKTKLVIEFDSEVAAYHFGAWLCGSGEQEYWDWMRYREDEEDGQITAVSFSYHPILDATREEDDPDRYGEFLSDWTIRTELGRTDKD